MTLVADYVKSVHPDYAGICVDANVDVDLDLDVDK